jgi:hypothetical protein
MADTTPATTANSSLPAEFAQLPLHAIIADPLMAAIDAQGKSALATQSFIQGFLAPPPGSASGTQASQAMTVNFNASISNAANPGVPQTVSVSAPLLSIVPVPNMRIDSLSVSFKYEVSQVITSSSDETKAFSGSLGSKAGLALWSANLSLTGSISSDSKQSSTTNRSGVLDIEMHASESPMPEGLAKILSILSNSITVTPVNTTGTAATGSGTQGTNGGSSTGTGSGTQAATGSGTGK